MQTLAYLTRGRKDSLVVLLGRNVAPKEHFRLPILLLLLIPANSGFLLWKEWELIRLFFTVLCFCISNILII